MSDQFPAEIGKYKVQGIIAKGGMGVVYKAVHPSLKRNVVIKKMTARKNSINIERFKREAQILLDLQSPNIVHLFDYFQEGGYRYMVEELVDGLALDKLLRKQTVLSPQIAMLLLQDCCVALKYAHSKDIVHRDIKPGNILISKRAEIKLADFGIATDTEKGDDITQSGVALGTPAYMPPEQFENSAKVDQRADIYALGIMLYEMVTGTKPYPGTLSVETLNTIKKGKYISPKKIDKNIPLTICRLIKKMLQPNPKHRFQSINPILSKVIRYLKHYNIHDLRVQLAKLIINPKAVKEEPMLRKDLRKRNAFIISGAVLLFCGFGIFSWTHGWIHKSILRHWYTPVTVEMTMPRITAEGSSLPATVFFYKNEKDIPNVKDVLNGTDLQRTFEEVSGSVTAAGASKHYRTGSAYLESGLYRAKVVIGSFVLWQSFVVGDDDLNISVDFNKDIKRNEKIKVIPRVFDSETGKEIKNRPVEIKCISGGQLEKNEVDGIYYVNQNQPGKKEALYPSIVYKFIISCEGYKSETFSCKLDWFQDALYVSANLNPVNSAEKK